MAIDWNKLVDDLKTAKRIAEEVSKGEDGGTANLDYVYIELPRAREKKVQEIFEKAGLYTRKRTWYGGTHFSIGGIRGGQGNANVRATEAVRDYMKSQGWDVGIICIAD